MSEDKYISFEPWWSGHSNIMMSFSLAAAISEITGRKLILPPKWHILFFTGNNKENFQDWWSVVDKESFTREFNCVEYYDIPEYVKLESDTTFFNNIESVAKVYSERIVERKLIYTCDVQDKEDFEKFNSDNKTVVDLNVPDKFIHFSNNLFGHFYYHVYANDRGKRLDIKRKIKNGLKYKQELLRASWRVGESIGPYNAIHVRKGDFERVRSHTMQSCGELLNSLKSKIPNNRPLYIATDKKEKSFFLPLRRHYNVFFYRDFDFEEDDMRELAVEQLICSQSEIFLGSNLSTFSDYINIFRGYRGDKKDFHRQGVNFNRPRLDYVDYPWEKDTYSWSKIWDYQWTNV